MNQAIEKYKAEVEDALSDLSGTVRGFLASGRKDLDFWVGLFTRRIAAIDRARDRLEEACNRVIEVKPRTGGNYGSTHH